MHMEALMSKKSTCGLQLSASAMLWILAAACSTGRTPSTGSSAVSPTLASGALLPSALPLSARSDGRSEGLALAAVAGSGSGIVNVTTNARDGDFTVNTEDNISVHDLPPGTVLYVRAAADVGLPNGQQS